MKASVTTAFFATLGIAWATAALAQSPTGTSPGTNATPPVQMPSFRVEAEAETDHYIQGPFLPDLQGTRVNVGKKTSILDFDSLPRINGNNYRQALAHAPGLILSEETSPLVSIGYRGLEPHRAQFTQVLKDGIPIHADQLDIRKPITRHRSTRWTALNSPVAGPR